METLMQKVERPEVFRLLCAKGMDGATSAHWAASAGNLRNMECILRYVCNHQYYDIISMQDAKGNTTIHWAVKAENVSVLSCILSKLNDIQLLNMMKIQDWQANSALHYAALNPNHLIMKCILDSVQQHVSMELLVLKNNPTGQSALHLAIMSEHCEVARCILKSMQPDNALELLSLRDALDESVFDIAASQAPLSTLIMMIECFAAERRSKLFMDKYILADKILQRAMNAKNQQYSAILAKMTLYSFEPEKRMNVLTITDQQGSTILERAMSENKELMISGIFEAMSDNQFGEVFHSARGTLLTMPESTYSTVLQCAALRGKAILMLQTVLDSCRSAIEGTDDASWNSARYGKQGMIY